MHVQPIGYGIKGFYRVAKIGHRWDMNPHAQKRIKIRASLQRSPATDGVFGSSILLRRHKLLCSRHPWR